MGAVAAGWLVIAGLVVAAVVYRRMRIADERVRSAARVLGLLVHAAGVGGIVVIAGVALATVLRGGMLGALLWAPLSAVVTWWISGGIAMRLGVTHDELLWWLPADHPSRQGGGAA